MCVKMCCYPTHPSPFGLIRFLYRFSKKVILSKCPLFFIAHVTRCTLAIRSSSPVSVSSTSPPPTCIQTFFVGPLVILYFLKVVTNLVIRSFAISCVFTARTSPSLYSRCCRLHFALLSRMVRGTHCYRHLERPLTYLTYSKMIYNIVCSNEYCKTLKA